MPFLRATAVTWVVAALLSTGCSDLGTKILLRAQSEISALSLDFGTVAVGQSATRTLTVRNTGTASLSGNATLNGEGYDFVSGGGVFSVEPGGERAIEIRFRPAQAGSFPATLDLGPESALVSLLGTAADQLPGAASTVDPAAIDFGFVQRGQTATESFDVHSVGTAPVLVNVVSTAADVAIIAGGGTGSIDPGASRTVVVRFTPQAGGRIAGQIVVGPGCPSVDLAGIGVTVSFASDVYPIFQTNCLSCHLSPSWAAFDAATTHLQLVNRTSMFYPPNLLVKPFEPDQSVLWGKVSYSGQFGGGMPQGGMLSAHDKDLIRTWILEGAPNN